MIAYRTRNHQTDNKKTTEEGREIEVAVSQTNKRYDTA